MTASEFIGDLQKVEALAEAGLKTAAALSPDLNGPVSGIAVVLPIVSELITVALSAWSKANGQPITPEAIQALLPNATPLTPPDAA